jgi:hypothetical protein
VSRVEQRAMQSTTRCPLIEPDVRISRIRLSGNRRRRHARVATEERVASERPALAAGEGVRADPFRRAIRPLGTAA